MEDSLLQLFLTETGGESAGDQTKEKISCPICCKELGKWALKQHLQIHTKEKSKKCDHCDKLFRQSGSLRRHIVQIHNIIEGDVKKYYKKYDSKNKDFPCRICDKILSSKASLKNHNLVHTGLKTERCNECDKSFINNYALQKHIQSSHVKNKKFDIEPYTCDVCSKEVLGLEKLKQHKRSHRIKNKICNLCPYRSYSGADLARHHEARHEENHCIKCDLCDRELKTKQGMKAHMKEVHSTLPPVECQFCKTQFKKQVKPSKNM